MGICYINFLNPRHSYRHTNRYRFRYRYRYMYSYSYRYRYMHRYIISIHIVTSTFISKKSNRRGWWR